MQELRQRIGEFGYHTWNAAVAARQVGGQFKAELARNRKLKPVRYSRGRAKRQPSQSSLAPFGISPISPHYFIANLNSG